MTPNPPASTVRLGVLGAAKILAGAVAEPARQVPEVRITAIAARDRDRALAMAAEHGIDRVLESYEAILADPDVDAVYLPTPAALHGVWTRRAIEAGKHVLCEKPLTANGDEAGEIADLAASSGLVVMEALHSQHHPAWARVRDLLAEGVIGRPRSAEATFLLDIGDRTDIRWQPGLGGGALMDLGVYPLRFLQAVFGAPVVRAATATDEGGVDAEITVRLDLPGGVDGTVRASMVHHGPPEATARIVGDAGTMTVPMAYHPQRGGRIEVERDGRTTVEELDRTPTYEYMLRVFAEAVLHGGPVVTDVAEAVTTMRAIDAAYRAAGMAPRRRSRSR